MGRRGSLESKLFPFGLGTLKYPPNSELMGTKGANLAIMADLGLPVPPGFVLGTALGEQFAVGKKTISTSIRSAVSQAVASIESNMSRKFGGDPFPLLLSVRSGAAISMPGMMDTVLNLGMNDATVSALSKETGDPRFAWDSYRRFIQSFAMVVLGLDSAEFEDVLEDFRQRNQVETDAELSAEALQEITNVFLELVRSVSSEEFPQDPYVQLDLAMLAVFRSWNTPRAQRFRDLQDLSHEGGTAAVIQAMVFGNRDDRSCTGVYFTRNPSTGEAKPYGEYMPNAQGEDVVSGIRTPMELTEAARSASMSDNPSMEKTMPKPFRQLLELGRLLEKHFLDMQEIEFTVESGQLYVLQTRSGKRTPRAGLKVAIDMASEGLITKQQAVNACDTDALEAMLVPQADVSDGTPVIAKGLPASPGAATGEIVFSSEDAVAARENDRDCILIRSETDPADVHGMHAANGILTSRGGMTSHAAVVARGMAKPCITAALKLKIDTSKKTCSTGGITLQEGDAITIDGSTGNVYCGTQPIKLPEPDGDLAILLEWRAELG